MLLMVHFSCTRFEIGSKMELNGQSGALHTNTHSFTQLVAQIKMTEQHTKHTVSQTLLITLCNGI